VGDKGFICRTNGVFEFPQKACQGCSPLTSGSFFVQELIDKCGEIRGANQLINDVRIDTDSSFDFGRGRFRRPPRSSSHTESIHWYDLIVYARLKKLGLLR